MDVVDDVDDVDVHQVHLVHKVHAVHQPVTMSPMPDPRARLIHVLRSACSGELAAVHAYRGHRTSLPANAPERERLQVIEAEEAHHRELVIGLLAELGAQPNRKRDAVFFCIGNTIAILCHIGGWFIPMYGAGRLESSNIKEYEDAAKFAQAAGHAYMIDCLLTMAEVEWEHEKFFRGQIDGHWMLRVFPLWPAPPPKETIRAAYELEMGVKIQDDQSPAETDQQRSAECAL